MVINKRKFVLIFSLLIVILVLTGFITGQNFSSESTHYVFNSSLSVMSNQYDKQELPLPKASDISFKNNNIRLDLEKIAVNKFFIIYSVIYGNQSHTAYHLYLTDLEKNSLAKDKIEEIWLLDGNKKIMPVAEVPIIRDFPQDQPLQWKIKVIVKFPYQKSRDKHSLHLNYAGQSYKLTDIIY